MTDPAPGTLDFSLSAEVVLFLAGIVLTLLAAGIFLVVILQRGEPSSSANDGPSDASARSSGASGHSPSASDRSAPS